MKVFKFGGASTNSYERIQNLATILEQHKDEKILIVISAMGKMTNALEKVAEAFLKAAIRMHFNCFKRIKNTTPIN